MSKLLAQPLEQLPVELFEVLTRGMGHDRAAAAFTHEAPHRSLGVLPATGVRGASLIGNEMKTALTQNQVALLDLVTRQSGLGEEA